MGSPDEPARQIGKVEAVVDESADIGRNSPHGESVRLLSFGQETETARLVEHHRQK